MSNVLAPPGEAQVRKAALELLRREQWKVRIRAGMFDKQLGLHDDPAQFKATHAGRRSGKSTGMPMSACLLALDSGFNEAIIIGAETQKKAKELHWASLHKLCVDMGLPFTPNVAKGTFDSPWGSKIIFWGLADNGAVELLRGYKLKGVFFDEVQYYASKLPRLISTVLEPALGDTGGPCTLYGTPSVTRVGNWADICLGKTPGWSVHHWTVRENKCFERDAESMLQQILLRNLWTEENPTYQREWMGAFVNDAGMQVFQYDPSRNSAESLPIELAKGFVTIGVDYGTTNDACAWTALWSAKGSRQVYVLESFETRGMLPDDAAEITRVWIDRWSPRKIVGDGGGLGAPYVLAFNRKYGHLAGRWVHPADKVGKLGQIAIVNGEVQSGRIKVMPAAQDLADALTVLPWKDEKREEYDPEYKHLTHLTDSFRYAAFAHMTDLGTETPAELTPEQKAEAAFRARQREAVKRKSVQGLLR